MSDCEKFEDSIQDLIAGSPRFEQLESVVEHCRECRECRELFELHRTLGDLGSRFDELETLGLDNARAQIIGKVLATGRPRRSWRYRIASWGAPFALRPLTAAAFLAMVFLLGLAAAHISRRVPLQAENTSDEAFIKARLQNMRNSPYSFSNVAVKAVHKDSVTLIVDVTKRVEIVQPMHSELVKGILTHAPVNPYTTGAIGHFPVIPSKSRNMY